MKLKKFHIPILFLALSPSVYGDNHQNSWVGKEYVRQCQTYINSLESSRKEINFEISKNNSLIPEINRLARELNSMQKNTKNADESLISQYNKKAERHDSLVRDYNARQLKIKSKAQQNTVTVGAYNRTCAGHQYDRADRYDAQNEH